VEGGTSIDVCEECKTKDCEEVKVKCEEMVTITTCEGSDVISCIWIEEEIGYKCHGVKDSCENIKDGNSVCEFPGAAVSVSDSNKITLECIWLSENTEKEIESRCENKVCKKLKS
jgi:hypothetical protein